MALVWRIGTVMFAGALAGGAAVQNSLILYKHEFEITLPAASTSVTYAIPQTVKKTKTIMLPPATRLAGATNDRAQTNCRVELTDNNTITVYANSTAGVNRIVSGCLWHLPDFAIEGDVTHGTITISAGQTSNTGNILTALSTDSRSVLPYLGCTTDAVGDAQRINTGFSALGYNSFGSPSSVIATRVISSSNMVVGFCHAQFAPGILASNTRMFVNTSGVNTVTVAIPAVVMANTMCVWSGSRYGDGFSPSELMGELISTTQFRASSQSSVVSSGYAVNILEFNPKWVKSGCQRGLSAFVSPALTVDTALSPSVVINKTLLSCLHHKGPNSFSNVEYTMPTAKTNAVNQNRCTRGSGGFASNDPTISWEEFELR